MVRATAILVLIVIAWTVFREPPDSADPGIFLALVRQQELYLLADHTIKALAEVHDRQEVEEKELADLISRAKTVLWDDVPMTEENLAAELGSIPKPWQTRSEQQSRAASCSKRFHCRYRPEDSDEARP